MPTVCIPHLHYKDSVPDSKVHEANMGPTWVLSAPGGPHVDPMNLAIRVIYRCLRCQVSNVRLEGRQIRSDDRGIQLFLQRSQVHILQLRVPDFRQQVQRFSTGSSDVAHRHELVAELVYVIQDLWVVLKRKEGSVNLWQLNGFVGICTCFLYHFSIRKLHR